MAARFLPTNSASPLLSPDGANHKESGRKCSACTDERKDQPFIGLVLMRNVHLDNGEYSGGDILDPNTGSIYRCSFKLEDGGKTLTVRGYLGVSLFGRTQKWLREAD